MSDRLYVTSTEARAGKAPIALGVLELLTRTAARVAVFRPIVADNGVPDVLIELLRDRYQLEQSYSDSYACTYGQAAELLDGPDSTRLVAHVLDRFAALVTRYDFVLCIGSDFTGPAQPVELALNATLAANLAAPVLAVVSGYGRRAGALLDAVAATHAELSGHGCTVAATIVNRVDPAEAELLRDKLAGHAGSPCYVLPEIPTLSALTIDEVAAALGGTLLAGAAGGAREVDSYVVGSGYLPTVLDKLTDGALLVAAGDRADLALGAAAAATSPQLPTPAGVVLTCGRDPGASVAAMLASSAVPVIAVEVDTYAALHVLEGTRGEIRPASTRKIAAALGTFASHVDTAELSRLIQLSGTDVVTPLMFSARLLERARAAAAHIVLPESDDERILRAAEELTHRRVVTLTLLGDPGKVADRAAALGLDLGQVQVIDPASSPLREELAHTYARLRAHKGVTLDAARDVVIDPAYFGTLLVQAGLVDGMVSGAAHTTAATIRPALELLRGPGMVSSAFFMCLPDRVLVFADCAVNPDPDAEQLADIACRTAYTAAAFGVEPRLALVSYATGASADGTGVAKVRRAAALVQERRPDLPLAGPIQYDAAIDPAVSAAKLPGNPAAGRATVLIFPDLNTGNTTYKAVQRAADAIAVGPVLQGLLRPVNDLSRGCTVADIVNTVAITAVQSRQEAVG